MGVTNTTEKREKLAILRKAIADLKTVGYHESGTVIQDLTREFLRLNRPEPDEVLYLDRNQEQPVKIAVAKEGTWSVGYVPLNANIQFTHQGNLYDELGNAIYSQGV